MYLRNLLILSALLFVTACARKQQAVTTPWGETIGDEEARHGGCGAKLFV